MSLDQIEKTKNILAKELTEDENREIITQCLIYDSEHKTNNFETFYSQDPSLFAQLIKSLNRELESPLPPLVSYDVLPQKLRNMIQEKSKDRGNFFHNQFIIGLIHGLSDSKEKIEKWIEGIPDIWSAKALSAIYNSAILISNSIRNSNQINYSELFIPLMNLDKLKWREIVIA